MFVQAFIAIDLIVIILYIIYAITHKIHSKKNPYPEGKEAQDPGTFGSGSMDSMWGGGPSGRKRKKTSGKKIARKSLFFFLLFGVIPIAVLIFFFLVSQHHQGDETVLNEYPYDDFMRTSYDVTGEDRTIFEHDGIRLSFEGIYAEPTHKYAVETDDVDQPLEDALETTTFSLRRIKLGFKVENQSDEVRKVRFDLISVNGIAVNDSLYVGPDFKPHKTQVIYCEIWDVPSGVVKEMCFGNFNLMTEDYDEVYFSGNRDDLVRLQTDADYIVRQPERPETSRLVYESSKDSGKGIRICCVKYKYSWKDEYQREVWIYNDSDEDYKVESDEPTQNGDKVEDNFERLYEGTCLPAHNMLIMDHIYPYLDGGEEAASEYDKKYIGTIFTFTDMKSSEKSFKTPYVRINDFPEMSKTQETETEPE